MRLFFSHKEPAFFLTLFLWLCACPESKADIYADFEVCKGTTPLGTFRVRLDYDKAPHTCANFIGLAKGTLSWLDFTTGQVRRAPYYDGLIFPRLNHGFVIQGGSPSNTQGGGPGYLIRDEFDPSLRHDGRYILSMANSGPNTGGSQFFIVLNSSGTPWLDDRHSVFGEVISGRNIIDDFADSSIHPTPNSQLGSGGEKPLTDIIMKSVTITSDGTPADQAFDETAQGVPTMDGVTFELARNGAQFLLNYTEEQDRTYYLFSSPQLSTWNLSSSYVVGKTPDPLPLDVSGLAAPGGVMAPSYFFRFTKAVYAFTAGALPGSTMTFNFTLIDGLPSSQVLVCNFSETPPTADYTLSGAAPGTITDSLLTPREGFNARIQIVLDSVELRDLDTHWDTATGGRFTGILRDNQTSDQTLEGSFTYAP